ncbi:MAG: choice-of-anchor B family protein [Acidobacteriota bacterium]|nr:choice-of-anchor B family protein [Acidobacteriota bacterium]
MIVWERREAEGTSVVGKGGPRRLLILVSAVSCLLLGLPAVPAAEGLGSGAVGPDESFEAYEASGGLTLSQREMLAQRAEAVESGEERTATEHAHPCVDGMAEGFPCQRVDLLAHMPLSAIGGGSGADLWGWTDPATGKEYALMGRSNGTAFVDVSDPEEPVYLGDLPTHTTNSTWRDVKTYGNYAYITSEASGHGLQIFDLTQLDKVVDPPVTFSATAHYDGFGRTHNVVINDESGFAYGVGSRESDPPFEACSGGLHMLDLTDPLDPAFAGCFGDDGYTHDAQCVIYHGPDTEHDGAEICFNSNEDTLTIVDVTDKGTPVQLSRTGYMGFGYTHQAWLTEDHAYLLMDDELDEGSFGHNTKTYIWDLADLDSPQVLATHTGSVPATDHNQYVHDGYVYQANYRSGLRILSLQDIDLGVLTEVAFFDIYPTSDSSGFQGAWSVYPYFESGTVLVSGIGEGLFLLRPILCQAPTAPDALTATAGGDLVIDLSWTTTLEPGETLDVYRAYGDCPGGAFEQVASGLTGSSWSDPGVSGQVPYSYQLTRRDATGFCESEPSPCASATTTGACIAPPVFGGLAEVTNLAGAGCGLQLDWPAATANCGGEVTYSVYRGSVPGFIPDEANRIAQGLILESYVDTAATDGEERFYAVRARDGGNDAQEDNLVRLGAAATGPLADGLFGTGAEVGDPNLSYNSTVSVGGGTAQEHIGWELSGARASSGDRSFFSTYSNQQCTAVLTPPLTLTSGQISTLSFWTIFNVEYRWDGGVVQLSDDGGATWQTLGLTPDYPTTFRASSDACGFEEGDPAFTGLDFSWDEYVADLSPWQGMEVQIRWIFSTDGGLTEEGWYVDDITLEHVQVPGSCTSAPGPIFGDGFEAGNLSAWSFTQLGGP